MATDLTVIKLGGSVITDKKRESTVSEKRISRLMKEICEGTTGSLIIVHGGGSYGHHLAKRYRLPEGYKDPSQIYGFVRTRQSMTELNKIILDLAIKNSLSCVSLQPSAFIRMNNRRIESTDVNIMTDILNLQMVPLLYGDVVLDQHLGFCILSGDQLASWLAADLVARQLIFAVDVDGVFDSDPKLNREARLIQRMTAADVRTLIQEGGESTQGFDVTGQMIGKLKEMLPAIEKGIRVVIVNGRIPGRVSEALKGRRVIGTIIEP